jgi:hypothetical protein
MGTKSLLPVRLSALLLSGLFVSSTLPGDAAAQPAPQVSPDPIADVPPTTGDPFPFFDNYSWRSFIALNWPAQAGAANRGSPDRARAFGDAAGPRVWMTWKSRFEIFQPGGAEPAPWDSYAGQNPCGAGAKNDVVTLSSFSAFSDFNQAIRDLKEVGNPLVAQNKTYVRYEVRVNRPEFKSIFDNGWYLAGNLPKPDRTVPFNMGSIEIKAAWRILNGRDTPAVRSRYYVVPAAQVFDVAANKCMPHDIALVGFHIVAKTPNRPQWIWSTFEHVDNVPGTTTEPKPPAGIPLSFNDPAKPQALDPSSRPDPISATNPPLADPKPTQVIRKQQILEQTMKMNRDYWELPGIKGTVWQNYMLVMTQWPTKIAPEEPLNNGMPFPDKGSALSNTTMETYFQFDRGNCMSCHQISNAQGRDFVMFVTMDAFRPNVPAPADLFATKATAAKNAPAAATPLAADPVVKSLIEAFKDAKSQ